MNKLFVPYVKDSPAAIDIKGHKVLLVTADAFSLETELSTLGGDSIREIFIHSDSLDETEALAALAEQSNCGVVVTPQGVGVTNMIRSLEHSLPWLH